MNYTKTERKANCLDVIRIIACIMVVMVHSFIDVDYYDLTNKYVYLYMFFRTIANVGVPLFVMISGALFLKEEKEIGIKKIFLHYIPRLWIIYFVTGIACNLVNEWYLERQPFEKVLPKMFCGYYQLWYIPMIIGLYSLTPVIRLICKRQNINIVKYLLLFVVIFQIVWQSGLDVLNCILPEQAEELAAILQPINIVLQPFRDIGSRLDWGFYFILGWYLSNNRVKHRVLLVTSTIGVLCINTLYEIYAVGNNLEWELFCDKLKIVVFLLTVFIFDTCHYIKISDLCSKTIVRLSKATLGVYLIHPIIMDFIQFKFQGIHNILRCVIVVITTFSIVMLFNIMFEKYKHITDKKQGVR